MKAKLKLIVYLVALLWIVFIITRILPGLQGFGIVPRTTVGLIGIFTMPLLHRDYLHLVSNTVPLLVLSILTVAFYERIAIRIMALISLLGGLLLWGFGRPANHIGASGLIYGLAAFLIASGIVRKNFLSIAVSGFVLFIYGGVMWQGLLPTDWTVSWEGHVLGAVAGCVVARKYPRG